MNRAAPGPSCGAWFWEQKAATYTLSTASTLQMEEWEPTGRGNSGTKEQSWEEGIRDPHLRGSLLLTWQPQVDSEWRVGGCQAGRGHGSRSHMP